MSFVRAVTVIFVGLAMPLVVVLDTVFADRAATGISRSQCCPRDAADCATPGAESEFDAAPEDGAGAVHDEPWHGCRGAAGIGILEVVVGLVLPAPGLSVPLRCRGTGIIRGPPARG